MRLNALSMAAILLVLITTSGCRDEFDGFGGLIGPGGSASAKESVYDEWDVMDLEERSGFWLEADVQYMDLSSVQSHIETTVQLGSCSCQIILYSDAETNDSSGEYNIFGCTTAGATIGLYPLPENQQACREHADISGIFFVDSGILLFEDNGGKEKIYFE